MYNGYVSQISTTQLQRQLDLLEETQAQRIAARALGLPADSGKTAVNNEMLERAHLAISLMDFYIEYCANHDYEDWVQETQDLRHGG